MAAWADNLGRLVVVPHDAEDEGDPLKIGGRASAVSPGAVGPRDRTNAWLDLYGRLVMQQLEITGESQTMALLGLLTSIQNSLARIETQLSFITEVDLS